MLSRRAILAAAVAAACPSALAGQPPGGFGGPALGIPGGPGGPPFGGRGGQPPGMPGGQPPGGLLAFDLESLIDRGLFYLQRLHKSDGSFESAAAPTVSAALACLAFLAAGHTPDLGRYGRTLRSALDFVLAQADKDGYFGQDGSGLDGHAIATLALAQAHGTELDEGLRRRLREALEKAMRVLATAQDAPKEHERFDGGWRAQPDSTDADLLVTNWCVAALVACQDVGLTVPQERLDRAAAFVTRCYDPQRRGFGRQPGQDPTVAMTAAGMSCLQAMGAGAQETAAAAAFLIDNPVRDNSPLLYYALLQTTQASMHADEKCFSAVWKSNLTLLRMLQRRNDGAFGPRAGDAARDDRPGRFQSTAMACLALAVPLRLLPMFWK
jgi:hypothetical protein